MRSIQASPEKRGRTLRRSELAVCATALAACLAMLLPGRPAVAQDFTLHLEPAAAFFLGEPQKTRFKPGFYGAVRPGVSLGRYVALQLSYAMLQMPAGNDFNDGGSAHFVLAGVRVRPLAGLRPASEQLGGLFVDVNLGYVRTGDLNRFGLDAGLGYTFQVAPWFALGPVVRYVQIVQADNDRNTDPRDAKLLTVGLDLAFGPAHRESRRDECPAAAECVQQKAPPCPPPPCPDADGDGVCDADDRCPNQPGPAATLGCPIDPCGGKPLVVLVQFDFDSAGLPAPKDDAKEMDPMLDAVAKAIAQEPACRVCIIGQASEEGPVEYNLDLSRKRALAVQGYLTARGLEKTRMPTVGLGARCQIVPETSRTLNRRVEFRRLQDGEACPTDCSPQVPSR
jgi:outer membrane protein OmpA-like peptidoglycan-associated protein